MKLILLLELAYLTHATTATTTSSSYPPLPSGCHADNVVNAIRNHGADAISYCKLMAPSTGYTYIPQSTYYTTITSGVSTTTSTYPARRTDFTNVYRGNGEYSSPPYTYTPITYTNTKPSIWTVNNADPTPTYLTPYDPYRIYTGCTCVVTPTTTSTIYPYNTVITKNISPTATYTLRTAGAYINYPPLTYGALCNPSIYVNFEGLLVKTVSANRAVQTISPIPTVRYKFQCCQLCADTFNCLWWRHSVSGACTYVWATDTNTNKSEYDKCINGYGGITIGDAADKNQPDSFGLGTCGLPDASFGEQESSQDSTEDEFQFQQNCAVFGGAYCT